MGKSTINGPFSIAMLIYQRVAIRRNPVYQWIKGTFTRKTCMFYGKIDGFRLRFSLEPIHWIYGFLEHPGIHV
jgi:hypothetical protein